MTTHPSSPVPDRTVWRVEPIDASRYPDFAAVLHEGFLDPRPREDAGRRLRPFVEFDRTLAAFDGPDLVGTALVRPLEMTLPGGVHAVAGVSAVAVLPTHRRRGILSALMARQLADIRARGEAVAALWPSEGAIYRRFGYGPAARAASVRLDAAGARLRTDRPQDPALRLRLADPHESRPALDEVHRDWAAGRNGEFARAGRLWDSLLEDEAERRGGFGPLKCALAEDAEGPAGYVLYRVRPQKSDFGLPGGVARVQEVVARTPAAHASLWEHVIERDLVATVEAEALALDDPLFALLDDSFQARSTMQNNLWARLVDLPAALERRSYRADVDLVLEVADRWCPWNAGSWRLRVDKGEARCTAVDADPDLRAEVTALGSAYLGLPLGRSLAAGDLTELREGAAGELAAALAQTTEPHCSVLF